MSLIRRIPATLTILGLLLAAGIATGGLWRPLPEHPWWEYLAYGLPALEQGRWWTPLTGTLLVSSPLGYLAVSVTFVGMAWLELRRGTRVALAYYAVGQLFAVFATSLVLSAAAATGWAWAVAESRVLDVGPSGGTFACLAAAAVLLRQPWRLRALLALLGFVFVSVLFWGTIAELEHLLAVLLVLGVDRSLRLRRASIREQRLLAMTTLVLIGVIELIVLLVPTDGPFGTTAPASGSWPDILLDLLVIGVVAQALRRGRRWAWVVALVLTTVNIVGTAAAMVIISVSGRNALDTLLSADAAVSLSTSVLWILMLAQLLLVRRAFAARRRARLGAGPQPTADEVRAMLHAHGGGTLSWMTTWPGLHYLRTATGIVAYQSHRGVAVALADPLGPLDGRADSVRAFTDAAEQAGLIPCFFSSSEATRSAVAPAWRSLVVADDTIVDLPGLAFTGKAWGNVRTAMNRAEREGMTFRLTTLAAEPFSVRAQLRAISETWVGDKGLPEMGFTLGTLAEGEDPEVRLALALAPNGDVDGFLSWLPVYGGSGAIAGWTLDLMRRRDGGFGPVMEYLIASSAVQFQSEGAGILSLSGAPLAHDYPPGAGAIAALSDRLAETLEPVYGFRSLHRFKGKFHPRYETMYLLFRDESDLGRIGAALVRSFLPDATIGQFAGAGLEMVRGRSGE